MYIANGFKEVWETVYEILQVEIKCVLHKNIQEGEDE